MRQALCIAVTILVGGTASTLAGANAVGVGAHVADFKASDAQDGKTFVGGQLRLKLGGGLGLEASVDYREDFYESAEQRVTLKSVPLLFSLTAELLPRSPITPYLLGGGGFYFTKIRLKTDFVDIDDSQTKFGYHLGAGVVVKPGSRIGIHADYRYTAVSIKISDLKFDANGRMITAGLTVYF